MLLFGKHTLKICLNHRGLICTFLRGYNIWTNHALFQVPMCSFSY